MLNLSDSTIRKLHDLSFDPEAKMITCLLPLGSVYWSDELPDKMFLEFPEGPDRTFVMTLFSIRINYWNSGAMSPEEQALWEETRAHFPAWPIFRRLRVTDAAMSAHQSAQKEAEEFFAEMIWEADEVTVSPEDGFTSYSATFNVREDE